MGTINYKANKYITIGIKTNIYLDEEMQDDIDSLYKEYIKEILKKYNFNYFNISIEPGYYDGLYLDIDDNAHIFFDNTIEKNEALKETTQLKNFLLECIEEGLCVCYPGWVTSYLNYEESKKELTEAIKKIKEEIRSIPTYKQYYKMED